MKPTLEEIRMDLHWHLIDLVGDVMLMDRFLFAQEDGESLTAQYPGFITEQLRRKLMDLIQNGAEEVAILADFLLFPTRD